MKKKFAVIASVLFLTFGFMPKAIGQWVFMAKPFKEQPHPPGGGVRTFAISDFGIFAGGYEGIYRSIDNGVSWDTVAFIGQRISSLLIDDRRLYANAEDVGEGLFRSEDSGKNWVAIDSGTITTINAMVKVDTTLFVGGTGDSNGKYSHFILRSIDNGKNWIPSNIGGVLPTINTFLTIGDKIFAGGAGILKSIDYGKNWTIIDSGQVGLNIYCFAAIGTNLFAGIGSNRGILHSTNDGESWDTSYSMPDVTGVGSIISDGRRLFAGVVDGVLFSLDTGKTWRQSNKGNINSYITSLIISGNYLFAGTESGEIWRRSLSDFSSVKETYDFEYSISITPNPTTGILTIRNAPESLTGISILNVLGQEVSYMAAPHSADFTIDLSKLPTGMYYARIATEGSVEVRKIVKE